MSGGAKKLLHAAAGTLAASGGALYVDDVFSTFLYTGTGNSNAIVNGIDLDGEGGLVWGKRRNQANSHWLIDTVRGIDSRLEADGTTTVADKSAQFTAFNDDGFTVATNDHEFNRSGGEFVTWTFRQAEKFFDVVKFTGNSTNGRTVAHNLGSVPAMIIIKNLDNDNRWYVWVKGFANDDYLYLNETFEENKYDAFAYLTADPTSTTVTLARDGTVNYENYDYVMYLFGDEAAFGDDGDESMVKVGSYTTDGSATAKHIDLGFEPQWVMKKKISSADNWEMYDTIRGWTAPDDTYGVSSSQVLRANLASTEAANTSSPGPTATGMYFPTGGQSTSATYIYIAIRRPMKTPEAATEVFAMDTSASSASQAANPPVQYYAGFPVDLMLKGADISGSSPMYMHSRLTAGRLNADSTAVDNIVLDHFDSNQGYRPYTSSSANPTYLAYLFKRAPGFMDVVTYTGTGSAHTEAHNLGVAPEMMIVKPRSNANGWSVYSKDIGITQYLQLHGTSAAGNYSLWNSTAPTATAFSVETYVYVNGSTETYIAHLFATLAGISKVGSVVHSGTTDVNCGFSNGARFVLVKRTDSTGDWYVWDSVRGIVSGDDPYLLMNTNAAQVTNTDYIDPLSSGFTLSDDFTDGTYIFLAIA